jgi:hypothetical protein
VWRRNLMPRVTLFILPILFILSKNGPFRPHAHRMPAALTLRDLNRATLARQQLLARAAVPVPAMVAQLAGLQAQLARPPFVGLWTRLHGFTRDALRAPVEAHALVRVTAMRGTLHVLTADDYRALRATLQPMFTAAMQSVLGARAGGFDLAAVLDEARAVLRTEGPLTFEVVRERLAARMPDADVRAMGYAVRLHLPLVQVPTAGADWGWDAKAPFALADDWLGAPCAGDAAPDALVRRYLAAFGPATPADAGAWSGVKGLRATFTAMRDELVTLRDERGRELFDLPHAPRPGGDVDAPVRFLPDFDNLVLGHDDRTRVVADAHRARIVSKNLQVAATVLVDGMVAATWAVEKARGTATLVVRPFARIAKAPLRALEAEGEALVRFVEPVAKAHALRIDPIE